MISSVNNIVQKMKLTVVLAIVGLVPFFLAVVQSAQIVRINIKSYENITQVDELFHMSVKMSSLMHELEVEFALSEIELDRGSGGVSAKLKEQRVKVDEAVVAAVNVQKELQQDYFTETLNSMWAKVAHDLDELKSIRQGIAAGGIELADVHKYYGTLILDCLTFVSNVSQLSDEHNVSKGLLAWSHLLRAKVFASSEIAEGSVGFQRGKFTQEEITELSSDIVSQNVMYDLFFEVSAPPMSQAVRNYLGTPNVSEIRKMRELAINFGIWGNISAVSANDFYSAQMTHLEKLNQLSIAYADDVMEIVDAHLEEGKRLVLRSIAVSLLALVASLAIMAVVAFALRSQLGRVASGARQMAAGDLTIKLPKRANNEIGDLIVSLAIFRDETKKAREAEAKARTSREERLQREVELAELNRQRSANIATELERTATAIKQLTTSVNAVTDSVETVRDKAIEIKTKSEHGTETVRNAVEAMKDIRHSSSEISSITKLIDEISFQTNLLALNARVEAARAGDAGRGFAVVAAEVQQLAARSAKAASDISELIAQSTKQVQFGSEIVDKSGDALNEIAESIFEISSTIQEVSVSSREQALAIEDINRTTATLDLSMQELTQASA